MDIENRVAEIIKAMSSPDYLSTVNAEDDIDWGTAELIRIGFPAVPQLIQQMEQARGFTYVLGQIRDPRAVEPLLTLLRKKTAAKEHYTSIVYALGEIGDPRAIDDLIALLPEAVPMTIEALGKIGNPRAIPPLQALLQNSTLDRSARWMCEHSLKQIQQKAKE